MWSNRAIEALDTIRELIELIEGRVRNIDESSFSADRDSYDLIAFRLAHIGEAARRLPPELTSRYPHIPWKRMYAMRNVIAHEYRRIDPARLWKTAREDLSALAAMCAIELERTTK